MSNKLEHKTKRGETLNYQKISGEKPEGPTIVWLGGFRSDMQGTKAEFVYNLAVTNQWPFVRFDYFGHGDSSGVFEDGNISQWLDDVLEVIDHLTNGPVILLGSSLGGWLAIRAALERPKQVKALVLIAPAPDFTRALMWEGFAQNIKEEIMQNGVWMQPSPYGPVPITRQLIEDGDQHLVLGGPIPFSGPVRIFQGEADADVPWQHALRLLAAFTSADVVFSLSKSGDHSLSSVDDLERLSSCLVQMVRQLQTKPIV